MLTSNISSNLHLCLYFKGLISYYCLFFFSSSVTRSDNSALSRTGCGPMWQRVWTALLPWWTDCSKKTTSATLRRVKMSLQQQTARCCIQVVSNAPLIFFSESLTRGNKNLNSYRKVRETFREDSVVSLRRGLTARTCTLVGRLFIKVQFIVCSDCLQCSVVCARV